MIIAELRGCWLACWSGGEHVSTGCFPRAAGEGNQAGNQMSESDEEYLGSLGG